MKRENAIKQLKRMAVDKSHTGDEYNAIMTAIKALGDIESLESEYKAYHTDSEFWRGVRYALDALGGEG